MKQQFDKPLPLKALNLDDKKRSNFFSWRGQFSPQLIENLLEAYCPHNAVILDPFCGSGTVLYEAGKFKHKTVGIELNPAAYLLSKTYELINIPTNSRNKLIAKFINSFNKYFAEGDFILTADENLSLEDFQLKIVNLKRHLDSTESGLLDALVILIDLHHHAITSSHIYSCFYKLITLLKQLPYSSERISVLLGDARNLPLESNIADFVITSPPYINVFNYHQNYRKSAELLGWDLLKIAKSEIGSNRANRGNRFLTVIQYSIDMALTLAELHRVSKLGARLILIVGHESKVLGVPFFNSEIISALSTRTGLFKLVLRQSRVFKNKFGRMIREDLLHLIRKEDNKTLDYIYSVAREIASDALNQGLLFVSTQNKNLLLKAIESVYEINNSKPYEEKTRNHGTLRV
jgi:tRNA G10  N-methylase Trm11